MSGPGWHREDSQRAQRSVGDRREIPRAERLLKHGIAESKAVLADENDAEMRIYAQENLDVWAGSPRRWSGGRPSEFCFCPKIRMTKRMRILEIRAGTGGDEATLFVAEMFRMYVPRFAETHRWKVEVKLSTSDSAVGGLEGSNRHH